MGRAETLILGALGLVAASCSSENPETNWGDQQTWSSRHFVYHARPNDTTVDASVLSYLEANATRVAQDLFGLDPARWGPIQYFKYLDDADFARGNPCGKGADAAACCAYFSDGRIEIHSPLAVDPHELVHAYAKSVGVPPPFLLEGLAVSVSCDPSTEEVVAHEYAERADIAGTSWTSAYSLAPDPPDDYVAAGMFTTWLVDHFGMSAVLAVYAKLPHDASASDFAAAVAVEAGASMDDVWQAMAASYARRPCMEVAGCSLLDPASTSFDRSRAFAVVPQAGMLVSWSDPTGVMVTPPAVRACSASDATSSDAAWPIDLSGATATTLFLPNRGGYVLTSGKRETGWDGGPTPPADYTSSILPASSVGSVCMGLEPIAVNDVGVRIQIWPSPAPVVFAIEPPESTPRIGAVEVLAPAGTTDDFTVDICSACDGGALSGCIELSPTLGAATVNTTGIAWLQVHWNPSSPTELLAVGIDF